MEEDESRNDHITADTYAQYIKGVKVDAPFFDGRLNPQAYID